MSWKIVVLAFVALLLAGCVQPVADTNSIKTPTPVKITLIAKPFQVTAGDPYTISWKVEGGQGKITHTAVHWDVEPRVAEYTAYAFTSEIFQGNTPDTFIASLTAPNNGTIFARTHAIVDGENVYSDEFQIKVRDELFVNPVKPVNQNTPTTSFSILASEKYFTPSTITVKKGEPATLVFNFVDSDIYYGGLDIQSELFSTIAYRQSDSNKTKTVTFTPSTSGTFTYTGYWPASGVRKASGTVVVTE